MVVQQFKVRASPESISHQRYAIGINCPAYPWIPLFCLQLFCQMVCSLSVGLVNWRTEKIVKILLWFEEYDDGPVILDIIDFLYDCLVELLNGWNKISFYSYFAIPESWWNSVLFFNLITVLQLLLFIIGKNLQCSSNSQYILEIFRQLSVGKFCKYEVNSQCLI